MQKVTLNSGYLLVHGIEKSLCSGSYGIAPATPLTLSNRVTHASSSYLNLTVKPVLALALNLLLLMGMNPSKNSSIKDPKRAFDA